MGTRDSVQKLTGKLLSVPKQAVMVNWSKPFRVKRFTLFKPCQDKKVTLSQSEVCQEKFVIQSNLNDKN